MKFFKIIKVLAIIIIVIIALPGIIYYFSDNALSVTRKFRDKIGTVIH